MAFNIQKARQAGYTDEEIQRYLASKVPQSLPAADSEGFKATDLIPIATGILGGAAGGFLGPVGAIGGGAIGSGAGEWLRQQIEGEETDLGKIGSETAWGLAGGAAGEALGAGVKIGGKLLGKGLGNMSDDLAVRALRPSKSQLTKFAELTGKPLAAVVKEQGLIGKNADEIGDALALVQGQYDDMVRNAGSQIDSTQYVNELMGKAEKFGSADSPRIRSLGDKLLDNAAFIEGKYKGAPIKASDLLDERRMTDQALPKGAFMKDEISAGADKILRNTQKKLIDEVADTGTTGQKLNELYSLLDIVKPQENLGAGTNLAGFSDLLGASLGGQAAQASGAMGGVPGMLAGAAATRVVNNPRVVAGLARGAGSLSEVASRASVPGIVRSGIGQSAARSLSGQQNTTNDQKYEYDSTDEFQQFAPPESAITDNSIAQSSTAERFDQILPILALADLQQTGGKNISEITALKSLLDLDKKDSKLTTEGVRTVTNANVASDAVDRIEAALANDPTLLIKTLVPGQLLSREFEADINTALENLINLQTGATATEDQVRRLRSKLPVVGDTDSTARRKIDNFKRELQQRIGYAQQ